MTYESETLESRMMRKYQVRFGGGLMEKGPKGTLASFLPNYVPGENSVVCKLTVRLPDGSTLTKSDAGGYAGMADSGDDDKSGFSDAFKRAAVKFGVGRYLYRDGTPGFVRDFDSATSSPAPSAPSAPEPAADSATRTPDATNGRALNASAAAPRSGRALFAWTKDQEQKHNVGLLKYLNGWAKLQDYPGRMVEWDQEQVTHAYGEACRKLQAYSTSHVEEYEEALAN